MIAYTGYYYGAHSLSSHYKYLYEVHRSHWIKLFFSRSRRKIKKNTTQTLTAVDTGAGTEAAAPCQLNAAYGVANQPPVERLRVYNRDNDNRVYDEIHDYI